MSYNKKGHYGEYGGNSRHSRVTSHNMVATKRDDEAHMEYLKEDVKYDNKHGHSDIDMTADEKHISKLAGDLKYDEKHHGAGKTIEPSKKTDNQILEKDLATGLVEGTVTRYTGKPSKAVSSFITGAQHHHGDIKESPGVLTQLTRRLKNDQTGGFAMARNLGTTMLALAPIPSLGKINAVKNIASAFGNTSRQYLRGKNMTKIPNPIPESTKTYNKLQYPMGKDAFNKVPKSKPVDFKGPNPAHKIGAGGNSYPK